MRANMIYQGSERIDLVIESFSIHFSLTIWIIFISRLHVALSFVVDIDTYIKKIMHK